MKRKKQPQNLYWMHPHFYNWMGGHKYILEVAKRLQKKYHYKVTIITSGLTDEARQKFVEEKIDIIFLFGWSTNSLFYWLFLPFFLTAEKWRLQNIEKIDPNALYVSSLFPSNALSLELSHRTLQVCYEPFAFFYDQDFCRGFSVPQRVFISFISFCYKARDAAAVQSVKRVVTLSRFNQRWIRAAYGRANSIIAYEGVDTKFFHHTNSKKLQKKYGKKSIIFHSTDYTTIKGTAYLVKALPTVLRTFPNLKLVISETLPHSPAKSAIVSLANGLGVLKAIEFAGFLPLKQLPDYLSFAKVVVQPSINQSMNLTVKEAMACGTPVITSPEGREQTRNGAAGFLVNPRNTSALAKSIIECLKEHQKSAKMGQTGRQIVLEKFTWDAVTAKIAIVLAEL
jgi:glycosyltransferase involved in cell wall biosynthesis